MAKLSGCGVVCMLLLSGLSAMTACQSSQPRSTGADGEATAAAAPVDPAWTALKAQYLHSSRQEHDHRLTAWETVASWDFEDGKLPEGFKVFDGTWVVEQGKLRAVGGKKEGNRTIGIGACQWPAFRLTFDASLSPEAGQPADRIADLGIRLNADPETASFARGYVAILAHYANQATVIHRLNVPFARTEFTPMRPGVTHRVMIEVVKPHIRLWVDGKVVLEAWERKGTGSARDTSDFMDMNPEKIIAIHTWDTRLEIDNMVVRVPVKAAK